MPGETTAPFWQAADQIAQSPWLESLSPPLRVALFMGLLGLGSTLLVTVTAFTRIVIVLSFVRRALSTQEIPPNTVVIGLAMFLTMFVMGPTLDGILAKAVVPYVNEQVSGPAAFETGMEELREFLLQQTRPADLVLFATMADVSLETPLPEVPLRVLIPAFVISEIKTAFLMGFCIYIPFLLIDLIVSTILMSLGMMMVPPMIISLPFKILLFILVDGWSMVITSLGQSYQLGSY